MAYGTGSSSQTVPVSWGTIYTATTTNRTWATTTAGSWDDDYVAVTASDPRRSIRDIPSYELMAEMERRGFLALEEREHLIRGKSTDPANRVEHVKAFRVEKGDRNFLLPDGSILTVDPNGNYRIVDEHAKVIYKANRLREFNPYINASDLLEDFIKFVGQLGVKQSEVLNVPINAFIHWLVFKAAERDGDGVGDLPSVKEVLPAGLLPSPE